MTNFYMKEDETGRWNVYESKNVTPDIWFANCRDKETAKILIKALSK